MASGKNYEGRSPNVLRYIQSCGGDEAVSSLIAPNLLAGARLAAKNESHALDPTTARTYELRLIALEKFVAENRDDAVLYGENKRPFLAATVQTFMREFLFRFLHILRWFAVRAKFISVSQIVCVIRVFLDHVLLTSTFGTAVDHYM